MKKTTIIIYSLVLFFISSFFIDRNLNNLSIGLIIIAGLSRKKFWENLIPTFTCKSFIALVGFVFITVLGMLYTQNMSYGVKVLERHAAFLIFPVIFIGNKDLFDKTLVDNILKIFTVIIILICILSATSCILSSKESISINTFYRDNFMTLLKIQPMYFAMFISLTGIWACNKFFDNFQQKQWLFVGLSMLLVLFSVFMNLLLATRMTLIALIIVFFIMTIIKTKKIVLSISVLIFFVISTIIIFRLSPSLMTRYYEISDTALKPSVGDNHNSVNMRISQWQCSYEIITSSPQNFLIGVGLGDVQDELNSCYKSHGWSWVLYVYEYNSHCQYLQTFATLGIIGLIALLSMLFYPLFVSYKIRNYVSIGFFILVIISVLTESFFLNQKGIVFFAFFSSIFVAYYEHTISISKNATEGDIR